MNNTQNGEIRVLHLYHDLMNLYGDWANVAILVRTLAALGPGAVTDYKSVDDEIGFDSYDFVFIGSGTERSQRACMRDLERHAEYLNRQIEAGLHILATGNSHELFGRAITDASGKRFKTLGLLDFETVQQDSRVTGDCVYRASFLPGGLIGFINRAGGGQQGSVERPFRLEMGPGADGKENKEGIIYQNLLGTYMTGPVLVRNPPLLRHIVSLLYPGFGELPADDPFFYYQEAAYQMALSELTAKKS